MQHVVVQLPNASWVSGLAHTVVAAWATSADLTLEEIGDARMMLDDMLGSLLEVSDGPVTMRLSSISLGLELSAPLRSGPDVVERVVCRSSLRRHGELP